MIKILLFTFAPIFLMAQDNSLFYSFGFYMNDVRDLDGRTDLFSLGMVFFELITGKSLWEGHTNMTILGKLQAESTIPPLVFPTDVPQEIQKIIEDLLRFNPNDRIQSADNLISRLNNLSFLLLHYTIEEPLVHVQR